MGVGIDNSLGFFVLASKAAWKMINYPRQSPWSLFSPSPGKVGSALVLMGGI